MFRKNVMLIFILLSFSQCKNGQDPEERRVGDKTVSFYINGDLWQNSSELGYGGSINGTGLHSTTFYVGPNYTTPYVSVEGNIWYDSKLFIMLPLKDTLQNNIPNVYQFDDSHGHIKTYWDYRNMNHMVFKKGNTKYLSKKNKGWAEVSRWETYQNLDESWMLHYEGRFEAILYNENNPLDSLIITDGLWNN